MTTGTIELTRLEALKIRRERLGMTQEELAEAADYGPIYGAAVQRGEKESIKALDAMEAALTLAERKTKRRVASRRKAKNGEAA